MAPFLGDLRKALPTRRMVGVVAGIGLPAPNDGVDIERVEFEAATTPAGALRGDERGATAEKSIEHEIAPARTVENGVGDKRNRLDCGMQGQEIAFLARPLKLLMFG